MLTRVVIAKPFMAMLVCLILCLNPALTAVAEETSTKIDLSTYAGKWVDQAYVEDEDTDSDIEVVFDSKENAAKLIYDVWNEESYTFTSTTSITFIDGGSGTFSYEYMDNPDGYTLTRYTGVASIELKQGSIILTMNKVPADLESLFRKPHIFIRDPYAGRIFNDAEAIVSMACKCKQSQSIEFDYPIADNEGNKNWIRYISVYVRGIFLAEYKVNLHKRTADNMKDSWSGFYQADQDINVSKVTATTTLPKSKVASYLPAQVVDGDTATSWCENVKGMGVGQSITIYFAKKTEISRVNVLPGYGKSVAAYLENGSVRKARITFSDGTAKVMDFSKGFRLELDEEKMTTSLKFTILEVYPGTKYEDTCVSEIAFK